MTSRQNAEDAAHVAIIQAQEEAERALRTTSTSELLRKSYQLTHLMHAKGGESEEAKRYALPVKTRELDQQIADLRAQRDMITNEILKRAGQ